MTDEMSRRDALLRLAALPMEMFGLSAMLAVSQPASEILPQCAAGVTACYHLAKIQGPTIAFSIVGNYIPTLKELVRSGSAAHRKAAADILAQCYLLRSTLAKHVTNAGEGVSYVLLAEHYADFSENPSLSIAVMRMQATAYRYANQREKALEAVRKAQYLLLKNEGKITLPPMLHSYVYAGLANQQAYFGQKQDAFSALGKAQSFFHAQPEEELPVFLTHHNQFSLALNSAATHLHLEQFEDACSSLEPLIVSREEIVGGKDLVFKTEATLNRVIAEVSRDDQPRDMEYCIDLWTRGIETAKTLQSEQWFTNAAQAYTMMRAAWPGEESVKKLRKHIIHW